MAGLQHGATNKKSQPKAKQMQSTKPSGRPAAKRKLKNSTIQVSDKEISDLTNEEKETEEPQIKLQKLMEENEKLKQTIKDLVENNNTMTQNKNNERLVEIRSTPDLRDIIEKRRHINFRQFNNSIEKFDGSKDFDQWWQDAIGYLKQFEDLGIQEKEKVNLLTASIVGDAKSCLNSDGKEYVSIKQIHEQMKFYFSSKISWHHKLMNCYQKPNESVDEFHIRLRVLATKAFCHTNMSAADRDEYIKTMILNHTKAEIKNRLRMSIPQTLEAALQNAAIYEQQLIEETQEDPQKDQSKVKEKNDTGNQLKATHQKLNVVTKEIEDFRNDFAKDLNEIKANVLAFQHQQRPGQQLNNKRKCYHCNKEGHSYLKCFRATDKDKTRIREEQRLKYQALNSRMASTNSQ